MLSENSSVFFDVETWFSTTIFEVVAYKIKLYPFGEFYISEVEFFWRELNLHLHAKEFQNSPQISVFLFLSYLLILGSSAFHIPFISTKDFAAFATLYIVNNMYAIIDMNFLLVYSKSKIPYLRATTF